MKYAIITPTFKPHFKFVDKYLESYNRFVKDKEHNSHNKVFDKRQEWT